MNKDQNRDTGGRVVSSAAKREPYVHEGRRYFVDPGAIRRAQTTGQSVQLFARPDDRNWVDRIPGVEFQLAALQQQAQ